MSNLQGSSLRQSLIDEEPEIAYEEKQKNSLENSNIFSKLTFHWVTPLMRRGNNEFLEQKHLDPLRKSDESQNIFENFDNYWQKYKSASKRPLYKAMLRSKIGQIILCFSLSFTVSCLDLLKPVMISVLIKYSGSEDKTIEKGILYLALMIGVTLAQSIVSQHSEFQFTQLGYCLNNSVIIALYKKSLRVSLFSNKAYKNGQIINLAQVDANRLYQLCNQVSSVIFLPLQLTVGLYLMYTLIGVSLIGGLIAIVFVAALNVIVTKCQVKFQKQLMKDKDQRMKILNEVFGSIKFIKVNAWEEYFFDQVDKKRMNELRTLKKRIYMQIFQVFLSWVTSPLIINSVFAWYTLTGNTLTAEIAFPVITLFNTLQGPIQGIPNLITTLIETNISVKRIQDYLMTEEIDVGYIKYQKESSYVSHNSDNNSENKPEYALTLTSGNFNWGKELLSEEKQKEKEKREKAEKKKKEKEEKKKKKQEKKQKEQGEDHVKLVEEEDNSSSRNTRDQVNINYKDSDVSSFTTDSLRQSDISDLSRGRELNTYINPQEEQKDILKNINLKIHRNQMVAVVGDVGCGKSSLLYSLIGEMKYKYDIPEQYQPKLQINGQLALVNQRPWIMSDTIRNNITFGQEFSQQKYDNTVQYASLKHDFTVLTHGDETMIGEKGVNLSGGQKARIALARALYSDADILLLDDILSAVDIHVGKHIVKECLKKYKSDTTRILITHALYYLKYMDYIYLMENGEIVLQGTYEEIQNCKQFQDIYDKFMKDQYEKSQENDDIIDAENIELGQEEDQEEESDEDIKKLQKLSMSKKKSSSMKLTKSISKKQSSQPAKENDEPQEKDKIDDLIMEEDRKKGEVGIGVYWAYCKYNGGIWFLILVIFGGAFSAALRVFSSLWMQIWTDAADKDDYDEDKNNFYLLIFTITSIGVSFGTLLRISTILLCNFRTIKKMHRNMVTCLLYAPLNEFFDRVPLGRILNRFSKDITVLDTQIAFAVGAFIVGFFGTVGTIFICVYSSSLYVLIPIVVYFYICIKVYNFYIRANREIVRLESITKSPVVSFFQESLNGLHSIRAYNKQESFLQRQCHNIDENKRNQISLVASSIWFRMTLTLCSIMINITSISFVLFSSKNDASMAGLLLTYAFQLDLIIRWMVMNMGWLEQRLVSFERCMGFLEIDSEQGYKDYLKERPKKYVEKQIIQHEINPTLVNWPSEGVIEFENVEVKYRKNLDTVIRGISYKIKKEEKIGIVGRTGAGKSTITLCLLRVLELYKGKIYIDGIDISALSLDQLRTKITIILQDPILFEGSLRDNVDPLREHTDDDIIQTLQKCNLGKLLQERQGLQTEISEGGGNLSVGEKQLLCIGRALLKKSKLILIDEATANIDIQTEHLVQQTIKDVFKDCTVLTIAHRINTILESDRILVLSEGKVQEFDKPQTLLKNPDSLFYKLHQDALNENVI